MCSIPEAVTWLSLSLLFGSRAATLRHVTSRLPGASPLAAGLLAVADTAAAAFAYLTSTPLRLLLPHLLLFPLCIAVLLLPQAAGAAFRAREAWHRCFMDVRLTEQASVTVPSSFSSKDGIAMQFGEGVWDLVRDFTADNNARVAAVAEFCAAAALAALVPLWLLLLPADRAAAAIYALVLVLAIFGLLHLHWWAEAAIDKTCERGPRPPAASVVSNSTSAFDGTIICYCLLCLLPAQLFLGSGHFCEFAGVHWPAAFVGFDESTSAAAAARSGALVAFNTFAPWAVSAALLLLAAAADIHAHAALLDSAAAEGHVLQRPLRVLRHLTAGVAPDTAVATPESDSQGHCPGVATPMASPVDTAATEDDEDSEGGECDLRGRRYRLHYTGMLHRLTRAAQAACGLRALLHTALTRNDNGVDSSIFDPSWSPQQWRSAEDVHAALCVPILLRLLFSALDLFCASLNAYVQRRHLMIWALFAPKWMFEVCFWAVTTAALLLVAVIADCCVLHVVPSRSAATLETQFVVDSADGGSPLHA